MNNILLGTEAKTFLKKLEKLDYKNTLNACIKGGIFTGETYKGDKVYVGFDCSSHETFVEEFDDIVEAAKYTSGIEAKTINGYTI